MKWLIVGNFLVALIAIFLSAFVFKEYKPSDLTALERRIIIHENKVMELSATLKNITEAFNVKQLFLKEMEDQQKSFYRDISLRNEAMGQEILSIKQRINQPRYDQKYKKTYRFILYKQHYISLVNISFKS